MAENTQLFERRTAADGVFEQLLDDILTLKLLPGAKLSESDVARRFGVSRQPVRDAFSRLGNRDLLLIRPQKATEVRGFSRERISHARFLRLAVELEVVRCAAPLWDEARAQVLDQLLARQRQAIDSGDLPAFHALDYRFHDRICHLAGHPLASETIADCKQKLDRLCLLSLGREREVETLWIDHRALAGALKQRDAKAATTIARRHLCRLDDTIAEIEERHADYFE